LIKNKETFVPILLDQTKQVLVVVQVCEPVNDVHIKQLLSSLILQTYPVSKLLISCQTVEVKKKLLKAPIINQLLITLPKSSVEVQTSEQLHCFIEKETFDWLCVVEPHYCFAKQAINEAMHWLLTIEEQDGAPNAEVLYADHDVLKKSIVSIKPNRTSPYFKPDWNVDLFYTQNYLVGFCLFHQQLVKRVKGFDAQFQQAAFFEWSLRATQAALNITHVSKILAHRQHKKVAHLSTSFESEPLNTQREVSHCKALAHFLKLAHHQVQPLSDLDCDYGVKIHWPLPRICPLVSLIIPTKDGFDILKQAVESIVNKTDYRNFEIIIVDNQTQCQKTLAYFKKLTNKRNGLSNSIRILPFNDNFNYSAINNFAVTHAKGSIIGFMNNDIEVINTQWLSVMVSQALRAEIGCVGAKLYYPNNTIQHAGVIVGMWGCAGHSHKNYSKNSAGNNNRLLLVQNYSAVTAACLLVRKTVFEQVNGFNEIDLTVSFNDVDLCLKVQKAGFRNLWTPDAHLYHHESVSRGADVSDIQIKRVNSEIAYMHKTWQTHQLEDPAYNANLSLTKEDFSLRK